jgi:excinuclease UvrABC ATPase subunit
LEDKAPAEPLRFGGRDWAIDLGHEGGEQGGQIVESGTPETIMDCPHFYTEIALKNYLNHTIV